MGVTFFLVAVDGDISILLIRIVVVSVVEYLADSFLVLVRVRLAEDRKEKGERNGEKLSPCYGSNPTLVSSIPATPDFVWSSRSFS